MLIIYKCYRLHQMIQFTHPNIYDENCKTNGGIPSWHQKIETILINHQR